MDPKDFSLFCLDTVLVICNVLSSNVNQTGESLFGLGISMNQEDLMV